MQSNKERVKHLLQTILFFAIAVWMLFYYLYPIFVFGRRYDGYLGFNYSYIGNVILTVVCPFIVFLSSIGIINANLIKCDYFCKHSGWWGLLTVLSVIAMIGGSFLALPPMNFIVFSTLNWFFVLVSLEILAIDIFVLSRLAKKRRRILGVTSYDN